MGSYIEEALWRFEKACSAFDEAEGGTNHPSADKHRLIMYGIAAITLHAARCEIASKLSATIITDEDQFAVLAYMLRCAPAHDISEPVWEIRNKAYRRPLQVGDDVVDLSNLNGLAFDFAHIGGTQAFLRIARSAVHNGWVASK